MLSAHFYPQAVKMDRDNGSYKPWNPEPECADADHEKERRIFYHGMIDSD